jgi:hypothetical protein
LTAIISTVDTDDVLSQQGINKLIAYKQGQRQEAAAGALRILAQDSKAQQIAARVGTIPHLIRLCEVCTEPDGVKTREAAAGAIHGLLLLNINRALLVEAGGIAALLATSTTGSDEARMLAAAAMLEISLEVDLRPHLIRGGAVPSLLALCAPGRGDATHTKAAAALAELANEDDAKAAVLAGDGGGAAAAETLAALLQPSNSEAVQERALGAVGFLCVRGRRNKRQALLEQSEAACRELQDVVGPAAIRAVVALCRTAGRTGPALCVVNQALAALAALCYRHEKNAAAAAAEGAVAAVVLHLEESADADAACAAAAAGRPGGGGGGGADRAVLRCNGMRALANLAAAYDQNRKRACQLGAGPLILAVWEGWHTPPAAVAAAAGFGGGWPAAPCDPALDVAREALGALQASPAADARGNRLAPARLGLAGRRPGEAAVSSQLTAVAASPA